LAAAAAATLPALAGRGHDLGLVVGVVAFGGLALLLAIAAAAAARRALPPGRVLRDTALAASLGVALVLAPVAARLLASAVAFVGQDPVAAPTPLGVAAVVGMLVVIALRMRTGPRSARPSPWNAPLLLAALLSGGTALGLLETRRQAAAIELGFDLAGLAAVRVELPGGSDATPEPLLAALRASPGVLAASATTLAPLSRLGNELARLSDPALGAGPVPVVARGISSGYHRSLGLEVVAPPTGGGLLVNRALARRLGGSTPLGLRLRVDGSEAVVVGVAPDIQHFDPEDSIAPILYYPLPQRARAFDVLVRVAPEGDRMSYLAVEERIRSLLPGAVVRQATPIGELHRSRLAWMSFAAALLGLTALSSSAIGLLLGGVRARSVAVPQHLSREVPRG
jgi:hypothetical protein